MLYTEMYWWCSWVPAEWIWVEWCPVRELCWL